MFYFATTIDDVSLTELPTGSWLSCCIWAPERASELVTLVLGEATMLRRPCVHIYSHAPLTRFSRPPIVSLASPRRSGSSSPRCLSFKSDSSRVQSSALRSSPSHSRHTCNFPGRSTRRSTVPLPPTRDSLCRYRNWTASAVDASYLFTAVAAANLKALRSTDGATPSQDPALW